MKILEAQCEVLHIAKRPCTVNNHESSTFLPRLIVVADMRHNTVDASKALGMD